MDIGMADDGRLAVFVVFEDGRLGDAIRLAESLLQETVGQHAEPLPQFVLELQGLLPPLRRDLRQCRFEIEIPYILTEQYLHKQTHTYSIPTSGIGILRFGFSFAPRSTSSRPFCTTL